MNMKADSFDPATLTIKSGTRSSSRTRAAKTSGPPRTSTRRTSSIRASTPRRRSWTATRTSSRSTAPGAGDTTTISTPTSRERSSSSSAAGEQGRSPRAVPDAALPLGLLLGLGSIFVYLTSGYGTSMLALWVAGLVTLVVYFWSRSAPAPRFPGRELIVPPALMLVFAPLYLAACSPLAGAGQLRRDRDHGRRPAVRRAAECRPVRAEHLPRAARSALPRLGRSRGADRRHRPPPHAASARSLRPADDRRLVPALPPAAPSRLGRLRGLRPRASAMPSS